MVEESAVRQKLKPTGFTEKTAVRNLLLVLLAGASVTISLILQPDPAGSGTHEQLGLPACGFKDATGIPGPSCGYTTAFAHQVRGNIVRGFRTQAMGSFLFWGTLVLGFLGLLEWGGVIAILDRISGAITGRHLIVFVLVAILAWIYKLQLFAGTIP